MTLKNKSVRTTAIAVLVLGVGYLGILPMFWPVPIISIECPNEVCIGEDLSVAVTVSAWHGSFHLDQVRITPNVYDSDALDITNPLYAIQIYSSPSRRYGWAHRFKLLTWPIKKNIWITVPLSNEHTREKLSPGTLIGTIDVTCAYAHYSLHVVSSRETKTVEPFCIKVAPK